MSKAYLTDSMSKEGNSKNKALISATYVETPLPTVTFRGNGDDFSPILAEFVQCFLCWDKIIPSQRLLTAATQPQAAAGAEPVGMPLYYVCCKTSLRED